MENTFPFPIYSSNYITSHETIGYFLHLASPVLGKKSVYNKNVSTCVDRCENDMGLPPLIGMLV